jgi:hypothetical protein
MYGDHQTYLAKSTDLGKTWTVFKSPEFTGFAHKIKEDLINRNLLFAGTEMGLFVTVDGGKEWFRYKNKVPDYSLVRDIQIHSQTHDLVLATHGRGILIVDDIRPLREMSQELAAKDIHLFNPGTVRLSNGPFGGGGFASTGGWVAPNPPGIPPIQYYLKEKLVSGKVSLEISDASGKLIQTLPGSNRKGINKVYWNLRGKGPKTASGGTKMDIGGFIAPMVLPGTYTVKLKVGEKDQQTKLVLEHDASNKGFTLQDRQLQHKTAMELFGLHEQLGKLVDSIVYKQKKIKSLMEVIKNQELVKKLTEYQQALEGLRGECLATKQKSMFADEVKLREEITEVYSAVCNQEAAPSNLQLKRVGVLGGKVAEVVKRERELAKLYGGDLP